MGDQRRTASESGNGHGIGKANGNGHASAVSCADRNGHANGNGNGHAGRTTQELLCEFQQTGRQAAFEEIARRYAGMVYNVALQVTRDTHDAEDATQAAFLTLAVQAKTAGKIRCLGPWLRKVAHRLALDIRRSRKRRLAREQRHTLAASHCELAPGSNGMDLEELRHVLREELDRLPAKYRLPLILYYFGGLTPGDMSKELRCNTSTLGVRLYRGRKMLADSLTHRGITINAAVVGGLLAGLIDQVISDGLVRATSQAAVALANCPHAANAAVSGHVLGLMQQAASAIFWHRVRAVAAIGLLVGSTLTGAAQVLQRLDLIDPAALLRLDLMGLIRPLFERIRMVPGGPLLEHRYVQVKQDLSLPDTTLPTWPADALRSELTLGATWDPVAPPGPIVQALPHPSASPFTAVTPERAAPISSGSSAGSAVFALPSVAGAAPAAAATPMFFTRAAAAPSVSPATSTVVQSFTIDRQAGDAPTYQLAPGGTLAVVDLTVGETSSGAFTQGPGEVHIARELVIGDRPGSSGVYQLRDTGRLFAPTLYVGRGGYGRFDQNGGTVTISAPAGSTAGTNGDGVLTIAADEHSSGDYMLDGGTLYADSIIVGKRGHGSLQQEGGSALFSFATLGQRHGGEGIWSMSSGSIRVVAPATPGSAAGLPPAAVTGAAAGPAIVVGAAGSGTFLIRSNSSGAAIQETPGSGGASLLVRSEPQGQGIFRGWGTVRLTGSFVQNGQVIADGFGAERALDFSAVSWVTNTIENPVCGGTNGWYARQGGRLILPSTFIRSGHTYTWGEDPDDRRIDLVNSVRFIPHGVDEPGWISMALLDAVSAEVPPLPGGAVPLSVWGLDARTDLASIELMVRYNDELARQWGIGERQIGLWVYDRDGWSLLNDPWAGIDTRHNLIWGTAPGTPRYFATSLIPEPGSLLVAMGASAAALLRRRRTPSIPGLTVAT